MNYFDPPSPSSQEHTTPRRGMPAQLPSVREKKPGRKLETPIVVAIISAVVTLITSIMGSPFLSTLINKTESPASTAVAELVISQNSLLPGSLPGGESFVAPLTPSEDGADSIEFTSIPQEDNPTSTPPLLESTLTLTILPTNKPDPSTPTASSFFQCITADLWFPYPARSNPENSNGCWNLAAWGFSTDQGRLLLAHSPVQDQQRGIYTSISGDVDIRFSLQLDEFRTRSNKAGFLNFGIVQNDPFSIYTGGYLSYQQPAPGAGSPVRLLISSSNQATQKISVLEVGFQHEVLLSIEDDLMIVYLNCEQIGDPVNVPPGDRAFWIGYVLPSKGELEVIITNFTIQTH